MPISSNSLNAKFVVFEEEPEMYPGEELLPMINSSVTALGPKSSILAFSVYKDEISSAKKKTKFELT